jgi:hypothetical protein
MVVVWTATSISMAQTLTNKANKAPASRATALAKDVQALRETVAAQQQQTEAQGQQMDQRESQLQQLLDATQQSNSTRKECRAAPSRRRRRLLELSSQPRTPGDWRIRLPAVLQKRRRRWRS